MEMGMVEVTGEIIPNDYGWIYDWLGWENTTPNKIKAAIAALENGEELILHIGDNVVGSSVQKKAEALLEHLKSAHPQIQYGKA